MQSARSLFRRSFAASFAASFRARRPTARARPALAALRAAGAAGLAALASGCFSSDTGYDPPTDAFYFPTGLVLSADKASLFVINSDFDLQYNGGTVFALDLERLRGERLTPLLTALNAMTTSMNDACKAFGSVPREDNKNLFSNENVILNPGPCNPLLTRTFTDSRHAVIGAFASGAALVTQEDDPLTPDVEQGERLFVSVRGDPSLTFFDVNGGVLKCEQTGGRCNAKSMVGVAPFDNTRRLVLPIEPVGIAASEDGEAIVVTHQSEQSVSLSVNRWPEPGPTLEYVARNLPLGPSEVAAVPVPRLARASASFSYEPGFLVTYRATAEIDLFRFTADKGASLPRPFLSRVESTPIQVNADGKDSRGIAIDASERKACEAACGATDVACLAPCVDIPLRVFVVNRGPASLLVGKIETTLSRTKLAPEEAATATGAADVVSIQDTVPLALGAAKVVVGNVIGLDGKLHVRVFAAAFDSRLVFSYDPEARRIDAVIRTGRGPHALVVDTSNDPSEQSPHALLYIGHFTDSYLGVVDLDMRNPNTFGTMFASVGKLQPPQESK